MKKTPFVLGQKVQWRDARGLLRMPLFEGIVIEIVPKYVRVQWDRIGSPVGRFTTKDARKELEVIS